jgi:hypothetical protein
VREVRRDVAGVGSRSAGSAPPRALDAHDLQTISQTTLAHYDDTADAF